MNIYMYLLFFSIIKDPRYPLSGSIVPPKYFSADTIHTFLLPCCYMVCSGKPHYCVCRQQWSVVLSESTLKSVCFLSLHSVCKPKQTALTSSLCGIRIVFQTIFPLPLPPPPHPLRYCCLSLDPNPEWRRH